MGGRSKSNQADRFNALRRQALVTQYRYQGFTLHQIHDELSKSEANFNPVTGRPWGFATIQADVRSVEERWKKQIMINVTESKNRQLEELALIKHTLWEINNVPAMRAIINALALEARIAGLESPTNLEHTFKADEEYQLNLLNRCLAQAGTVGTP